MLAECLLTYSYPQQFYGAKQFRLVGVVLQRCLVVCTAASFPIYGLWMFTAPFLTAFGIEAELSREVAIFVWLLGFGLVPAYVFDCTRKYLQVSDIEEQNVHCWLVREDFAD